MFTPSSLVVAQSAVLYDSQYRDSYCAEERNTPE